MAPPHRSARRPAGCSCWSAAGRWARGLKLASSSPRRDVLVSMLVKVAATLKNILHPPYADLPVLHATLPRRVVAWTLIPSYFACCALGPAEPHCAGRSAPLRSALWRQSRAKGAKCKPQPAVKSSTPGAHTTPIRRDRCVQRIREANESDGTREIRERVCRLCTVSRDPWWLPGAPRAAEMGTAQRMREHRVPNIAPTLRHTTSCSVRLPIEF